MQFPRVSPAAYVGPLADAACEEAGPELGSVYRAEADVVAGAGAEAGSKADTGAMAGRYGRGMGDDEVAAAYPRQRQRLGLGPGHILARPYVYCIRTGVRG